MYAKVYECIGCKKCGNPSISKYRPKHANTFRLDANQVIIYFLDLQFANVSIDLFELR